MSHTSPAIGARGNVGRCDDVEKRMPYPTAAPGPTRSLGADTLEGSQFTHFTAENG